MCGIVGIAGEPGQVDPAALVEMRDRMLHRGPDDAGVWVNEDRSVGLGHRRLSILDLSPRARQPMQSADGRVWIAFNGEIYNYRTLRRELEPGYSFRSDADTEVILSAYCRWGIRSVDRLRGMFAFALWDARLRWLWLVRDRLGIKPLFYAWDDRRLEFASEMKALTAGAHDETAIWDFLTYGYVPAPKTIYRGIRKLEPGHFALLENGRLRVDRYWDLVVSAKTAAPDEDAIPALRAKIAETVEDHLVADVPVGVMLSGGVDSSAVAAYSGRSVRTFSVGFDVASHSETRFARLVSGQIQSDHHECTVTREMAAGARDLVAGLYDEPFGDASAVPTYFLARLARGSVTVALSGEGGDEVFGGYNWYSRWLRFAGVPSRWLRFPAAIWPDRWRGSWSLQCHALPPIERYAHILGAFSRREKQGVFERAFARQFDGYDDLWHFRRYWRDDLDPLTRLQYLDLKTYLPDDVLTKLDRATMAVGLEGRVPLLDHELVELVFRLRANSEQKKTLKQAVQGLVPQAVLDRPKKGFSPPLETWFPRGDPSDFGGGPIRREGKLPAKARSGHGFWRVSALSRWLHQHT